MAELPMFPLGTVLVPSMVLPLHLFEPRYLAMVRDCLARGEPAEFGVVLIERGSEVGGDDVRSDVGTVAQIAQAQELDDGRWVLVAVGTRRVRVVDWLPDDPYPRAEVDDWPDDPVPGGTAALDEAYGETTRLLRRVLALRSELGDPTAPSTVDLADDPVLGTYQMAVVAPFGPADRQRVLVAAGPAERLRLIAALLDEEATFLQQRLALGE